MLVEHACTFCHNGSLDTYIYYKEDLIMNNKNIKVGLVTLFSVIALGTVAVQTDVTVDAADLGTPLQSTMYDPDPCAKKVFEYMDN